MVINSAGLGDWFSPSCTPGDSGCVPHWYCYIPGMATPDCLQSFGEGVKTLVSDVVSPVVGTAAQAVGGVVSGTAAGIQGGVESAFTGGSPGGYASSGSISPMIWIAGGAVMFALLMGMRR